MPKINFKTRNATGKRGTMRNNKRVHLKKQTMTVNMHASVNRTSKFIQQKLKKLQVAGLTNFSPQLIQHEDKGN